MGKNRQRNTGGHKVSETGSNKGSSNKRKVEVTHASGTYVLWEWLAAERQGLLWVLGCAILGALLGFGIGTGHLTGSSSGPVSPWRVALGARIRSTHAFQIATTGIRRGSASTVQQPQQQTPQQQKQQQSHERQTQQQGLEDDPSHPKIFSILREAIVRELGGFVHPDLGFLVPAPSGAARGVGMVKNSYYECQSRCFPGTTRQKLRHFGNPNPQQVSVSDDPIYKQEELLIKVPASFQMTRYVALQTLSSVIAQEALQKAPLDDLDDAVLLVLLLAHERGLSKASRWLPYIASLPKEPSCGYSEKLRPQYLDAIAAMADELDLDVQGWPAEIARASHYANKIANGLARDYGQYIKTPEGMTPIENLQWALCQVASRATAGSEKHGSLRLLPLLDQLNHDKTAAGFVELTGTERLHDGDFVEATEQDSGAFVVRSLRHGRRRALKVGQELLVNYNVPNYTPLDWFVNLGFVPPERWKPWVKIDTVLPRVRRDGPFNPEEEAKHNDRLESI